MDIQESIKTIRDRDKIISEIELVQDALYKDAQRETVIESKISKTLRDFLGDDRSPDLLSQKLSDLKKNLNDLVVVKLTLAFDPSEQAIERMITFLRGNLEKGIILDTELDPKILGGAIFEFRGLYKDYTLKTRLDEIFKNKRETILSNL